MANRTDPFAKAIKGHNPQFLIARIVRNQVQNSLYWKEKCFGLAADTLVNEAANLEYIGGTFGGFQKASPFLCLVLKMLQIEMDDEIIIQYLNQKHFKYLRCLAAFYIRMTGTSVEVYRHLEPHLSDYRKVRYRLASGGFELITVDEFIDRLLNERMICQIELPVLVSRMHMENREIFEGPRESEMVEKAMEEYARRQELGDSETGDTDTSFGPSRLMIEEEEEAKEEK